MKTTSPGRYRVSIEYNGKDPNKTPFRYYVVTAVTTGSSTVEKIHSSWTNLTEARDVVRKLNLLRRV